MNYTKIRDFKNGAWTVFDKSGTAPLYIVKVYTPYGELHDKIKCYEYSEARNYLRCFNSIAKQF